MKRVTVLVTKFNDLSTAMVHICVLFSPCFCQESWISLPYNCLGHHSWGYLHPCPMGCQVYMVVQCFYSNLSQEFPLSLGFLRTINRTSFFNKNYQFLYQSCVLSCSLKFYNIVIQRPYNDKTEKKTHKKTTTNYIYINSIKQK